LYNFDFELELMTRSVIICKFVRM